MILAILIRLVGLDQFAPNVKVVVRFGEHIYQLEEDGSPDKANREDCKDAPNHAWMKTGPILVVECCLKFAKSNIA